MVTDEKTVDLLAERSDQPRIYCNSLMVQIDRHLHSVAFTATEVFFEFKGDLNARTVATDICAIHRNLRPDRLDWYGDQLRIWWD